MENEILNGEWGAVANALADVVIERRPSTKIILLGIHAFLMSLEATGYGDAAEISQELYEMASYYGNVVVRN